MANNSNRALRNTIEIFDPSGTRWAIPTSGGHYIRLSADAPLNRDNPDDFRYRIRIDATEIYLPSKTFRMLARYMNDAIESKASKFGI